MDTLTHQLPTGPALAGPAVVGVAAVRALVERVCQEAMGAVLGGVDADTGGGASPSDLGCTDVIVSGDPGAALVEAIGVLEDVKNACAAGQALLGVTLRRVRESRAEAGDLGERGRRDAHRSAVGEVALARRESPHRAQRLMGLGVVLTQEMPRTWRAFQEGRISEWRAMLVARETACLSLEDRQRIDLEMAEDLDRLGEAELVARARTLAYRVDPQSVVARASRAEADRHVSLRPAPDTMARLSVLLPAAQGVGVYGSLLRAAQEAQGVGDGRGRGQVMVDTLVERVTGQSHAKDVPLAVDLVLSDEALLGGAPTPADLVGYGPIPAGVARSLVLHASQGAVGMSIRRLYATPAGRLVAMESTARTAPAGLARFIRARDSHTCRTPYCSAPIRHIDHVHPYHAGGPTEADNLQGLCQWCNQTKETPGWQVSGDGGGVLTVKTPTGERHATSPPPLPPPGMVVTTPARGNIDRVPPAPPRPRQVWAHHGNERPNAPDELPRTGTG